MKAPEIKPLQEYIIVMLEKNLEMERLLQEIHDKSDSESLKYKIMEVLK